MEYFVFQRWRRRRSQARARMTRRKGESSLQPRTSKTSERAPPAHASILPASCSRSLRASSPFARVVHFLTARTRSSPRRRSRARRISSPQYAWRESARRVELGAEPRRGRLRCARTCSRLHLFSEPLALAARLLAARARGAPPRRAAPGVRTRAASSLAPSRTPSDTPTQRGDVQKSEYKQCTKK